MINQLLIVNIFNTRLRKMYEICIPKPDTKKNENKCCIFLKTST